MKKIIFLFLLSFLTLSSIAQNKFGYIDSQELLILMPETKIMQNEIEQEQKNLESQLANLTSEFQQQYQTFEANQANYSELEKQDKIAALQSLEQRVLTFEKNATQVLQNKQQELVEPILTKARNAIEDVAKEGGFTYIFDKNPTILYAKESENILPLVKKKLGL